MRTTTFYLTGLSYQALCGMLLFLNHWEQLSSPLWASFSTIYWIFTMSLALWCSLIMSVIAPFAEAGWNAQIGCWWRCRNYRYCVWAKGKHDSTLSPVASLSQTLAVFFSKDLWAGSVVKVHHLSAGKSAEHDWIIWFSISEDWWVMFSEGHDNSSGQGVSDGFQKMPYLSSQGFHITGARC